MLTLPYTYEEFKRNLLKSTIFIKNLGLLYFSINTVQARLPQTGELRPFDVKGVELLCISPLSNANIPKLFSEEQLLAHNSALQVDLKLTQKELVDQIHKDRRLFLVTTDGVKLGYLSIGFNIPNQQVTTEEGNVVQFESELDYSVTFKCGAQVKYELRAYVGEIQTVEFVNVGFVVKDDDNGAFLKEFKGFVKKTIEASPEMSGEA